MDNWKVSESFSSRAAWPSGLYPVHCVFTKQISAPQSKNAICAFLDFMQTTFFYLGKISEEIAKGTDIIPPTVLRRVDKSGLPGISIIIFFII